MNIIKTKMGRIINFIKNEGKFKRGDFVEVLKNDTGYGILDIYVGQHAIVTNINYDKKDNIVGLKFIDGENIAFKPSELKKCDHEEIQSINYKEQLLEMI